MPLPELAVSLLKIHREAQKHERDDQLQKGKPYFDHGYVFATIKGTYTENRNAMRAFHRILKKAGIPKSNIHSLRHTYASRLLESGANIRLIADLLGHSDISTFLNTYAHVLPEKKKTKRKKKLYKYWISYSNSVKSDWSRIKFDVAFSMLFLSNFCQIKNFRDIIVSEVFILLEPLSRMDLPYPECSVAW